MVQNVGDDRDVRHGFRPAQQLNGEFLADFQFGGINARNELIQQAVDGSNLNITAFGLYHFGEVKSS